jgi:cell wall-associated NlpC family hydrolase
MKTKHLYTGIILYSLFTLISSLLVVNLYAQNNKVVESWERKADSVVTFAKSQLGATYVWGTCKPGVSFDCSGLTYYAYNKAGVKSSRGASTYRKLGQNVPIKESRKGDCILFTGTRPGDKSVGHVGLIVKNEGDKLYFIHCSSSTRHYGVVITEYYASNYPKRFIEIRRMIL